MKDFKFISVNTYDEASKIAADIFKEQLAVKPDSKLGLATGSTPLGIYRHIIAMYKNGEIDFSKAYSYNLDEYIGLPYDNEQSYHAFMEDNLFSSVNMPADHRFVPEGMAEDPTAEAVRYEAMVEAAGGIDLQLLGLGFDGHIGFNEPGDCFILPTHCTPLDESTIEANSRFFATMDEVPKSAITVGIYQILHAKKIVLLLCGEKKLEVWKRASAGGVDPKLPASVLLLHRDLTVIYTPEEAR